MANKFFLCLCITIVAGMAGTLNAQTISSQDLRAFRQRQIDATIKEKLHQEDAFETRSVMDALASKGRHIPEAATQRAVDALPPESEIHAAMNPTDSNNIVVSAMHFASTSGSTTLSMPIYYTNDFGRTWVKSTYALKPY